MKPSKRGRLKVKRAWGACVNLGGLYSIDPVALSTRLTAFNRTEYWDTEGNFDIERLGLDVKESRITFASVNKKEVELWISGASSVMKLLQEWSKT